MRARFYYPFLNTYKLEEQGVISDWHLVSRRDKMTVHILGDDYAFSLIEATVEDYRSLLDAAGRFAPYLEFEVGEMDTVPENIIIPVPGIVKTLIRRFSSDNHHWVRMCSRFVQWNPSYVSATNFNLSIEFFPDHVVILFWEKGRASYNVTPYHYFKTSTEVLRRCSAFAAECSNRVKSHIFKTQYFYLSLVYPTSVITEFIGNYIRGDRNFLHENFPNWGRFTSNDDPRIYLPEGEYPLRKIRF